MTTLELMNIPEVIAITDKMSDEKVIKLVELLHGFLERKEEINKTYGMTNDDEQLKAFAIETAKVLIAEKE